MNRRFVTIRGVLLAGFASLALLVAGCGGGAKSPSVASLETTTSSGAGSSATSSKGFPPSGDFPAGSSISTQVGTGGAGVKYSACMRSHGVPNYPDPDSQGVITITISSALNPSSPLFQKAQDSCQGLRPAGNGLSAARQQQLKARLLAFAACMRSHGVPNYPDPTFGAGGMVSQRFSQGEVARDSPIFQAAQQTCQSNDGSS